MQSHDGLCLRVPKVPRGGLHCHDAAPKRAGTELLENPRSGRMDNCFLAGYIDKNYHEIIILVNQETSMQMSMNPKCRHISFAVTTKSLIKPC